MMMSVMPFGDSGLIVNFEQQISRPIHAEVMALHQALLDTPGIRYMIPSYCALTVVFDLHLTSYQELKAMVEESDISADQAKAVTRRQVEVPVCYDAEFGLDLEEVSHQTGKSVTEIIKAHTSREFYVYMLGFMPGFAYMGDMPKTYFCRRRQTPRTRVHAGSVGLAALQTAVYPFESPGGWQIIGRTPLKLFDPKRDPPNFFRAGDVVRFRSISKAEFWGIEHRA